MPPIQYTPQPPTAPQAVPPPPPTTPPPPPPQPTQPAPVPEPKHRSKGKIALIVIFVLVLLGAGGYLAYRMTRPKVVIVKVKKEIPLITEGTMQGAVDKFYPAVEGTGSDYEVNQQIFEGLVGFTDGTKITPLLADSWSNPDNSTWVFKLKQNVKFHTGRTMTAQDVKYSLDNFKDGYFGKLYTETIKSVDVVDANTVKITTDGPDPILLNHLVYLSILDSQSKAVNDPINGTGPYMVKPNTTPTDKETDLVAFDDYHGGRPLTRAVTFKYYDDENAVLDAYKKGELNIAETNLSRAKLTPILNANSTLLSADSLVVYHIGFNFFRTGSPILNPKVRQAVYLATDPLALMKVRDTDGTIASQVLPSEIPGYDSTITRPERDIAKAKQLLTEAGYPNGVTLSLSFFSGSPEVADELARQLKEAGITLKPDPQGDSTYDDVVFGGKAETFFTGTSTDVLDGSDVFANDFSGDNYKTDEVDALIDKANQTLDEAARLSILQEISRKLMADYAWAPLYISRYNWIIDKSYVFSRDQAGAPLGINFWKVYQN